MRDTWKRRVIASFILLAAVIHQLFWFFVLLTSGIGISVGSSILYAYIVGGILPAIVENFVVMTFLSGIWMLFRLDVEGSCSCFSRYYQTYPNLLMVGTRLIYTIPYVLSLMELYIQFEATHLTMALPTPPGLLEYWDEDDPQGQNLFLEGIQEGRRPTELWTGTQWHTVLFLLALSYIVQSTSQLLSRDMMKQRRVTSTYKNDGPSWVTKLGFLGLQIVVNVFYSLPLVMVALLLHLNEINGSMTFAVLNVSGILTGVVFGVMETRRPWPVRKSLGSRYSYEANAIAKVILYPFPVLPILIFYYRPFSTGKIPGPFTAGNSSILFFCFFVAFAMLLYTKILAFNVVQNKKDKKGKQNENEVESDGPTGSGTTTIRVNKVTEKTLKSRPVQTEITVIGTEDETNANEKAIKKLAKKKPIPRIHRV